MDRLTVREREVSRLIASGLSNKEIGRALGCTEGTIKVHLVHIFVKLGLRNRTQLAVLTTGDYQ
jgi:DNA-binding NarL/FixJ family response regulator